MCLSGAVKGRFPGWGKPRAVGLARRHKNCSPSNGTSEHRLVFYAPICLQSTVRGREREERRTGGDEKNGKEEEEEEDRE